MQKKITVLISIIMSMGVMNYATATSSGPGDITLIHSMKNGAIVFYHNGQRTGVVPQCAQNYATRWAIDTTAPGGKTQASTLLTAYAQGKKISIVGTDVCDIWGDTETINWLVIQ